MADTVRSLPIDSPSGIERVPDYPDRLGRQSGGFVEDAAAGQWVIVEGRADMAAGVEVARKQALLAAYRQAINVGGSIEVGEFSQLINYREIADIVTKRSHGFIKAYETLFEGPESGNEGVFMVAIRAFVVDNLDVSQSDDDALTQFVTLIGSPKVLFILSQRRERGSGGYGSYGSLDEVDLDLVQGDTELRLSRRAQVLSEESMPYPDEDSDVYDVHSAEQFLAEHFRDVGYEVVTSDDIFRTGFVDDEELQKAREGIGSYAARVGKSVDADIVIAGDIRYQVSGAGAGVGTDFGGVLGTVSLTAKAIVPSSGKVLGVASHRERYMSVAQSSELVAREESLARASKTAADELKWEIPSLLARETRDVALELTNISYRDAESTQRFLSGLPGIDKVAMHGWSDNRSSYVVSSQFTGPRERDVVGALAQEFDNFEVIEVGYYKVVGTFD